MAVARAMKNTRLQIQYVCVEKKNGFVEYERAFTAVFGVVRTFFFFHYAHTEKQCVDVIFSPRLCRLVSNFNFFIYCLFFFFAQHFTLQRCRTTFI